MPPFGEFVGGAANPLFARLGKLTCNTKEVDSPNSPVFCVDADSSGDVAVLVEPLEVLPVVELLPVPLEVLDAPVDFPLVEGVPVPLAPVFVPLPPAVELVALVEPVELLSLELLSLELSDDLRKTTDRRSVSIRRNKARATCERSISTCPICE